MIPFLPRPGGILGNIGGLGLRFEEQYHCYSMAMCGKGHLEDGEQFIIYIYQSA